MVNPIDPTATGFLLAENRNMPMHVGGPAAVREAGGGGAQLRPRDVRADARRRGDRPALPQAPAPLGAHGRPAGVAARRAVRHRAPRAAQRAAQARPDPRAARAVLAPAQHPARLGAAAVGGARHRGPARRPGRDVHQDPPRAGRRRLGDAAARQRALHRPRPARHARALGAPDRAPRRRGRERDREAPRPRWREVPAQTRCVRRSASPPRRPGCRAPWSRRSTGRCATRRRRSRSTRPARCSTRTSPAPAASPRRTGRSSGSARSARPPARPSTTWCWRCAAARMRAYLIELDALPDTALVAMVPVGLNAKQSQLASAEGGNAVGSVMVQLGTDLADPADRLVGDPPVDEGRQGGAVVDDPGADPGDERARAGAGDPRRRCCGCRASCGRPTT